MKNTRIAALLLFAVIMIAAQSCASGGSTGSSSSGWNEQTLYPPTIANWMTNNPDAYQGAGISAVDGDEAYAIREATTIALGELARNIETAAAYVGQNYAERGFSQGYEATKNTAAQVIRGARTVGPVKASGKVYILKYVPRNEFDNQMKETARQARVQMSEAELNALLDKAVQQQN